MEIKFVNVSYFSNPNTKSENKLLSDINIEIPNNKISAISGTHEKKVIGKLICALERPNIGKIKVGKYVIEKEGYIKRINNLRFDIGYAFSSPKDFFFNKTVRKEIEYGMENYRYKLNKLNSRPIDSLKVVGLDESYLERNPLELSLSEQKKVMLAAILAYNPKIIILDEFEKGLSYQDKKNLIRLLKMLKNKYKRTIILISNDQNFLINLVDYYYIINKGSIVFQCTKEELFNKGIEKYIDIPDIVNFINLARNKGAKIDNYYELNELIKGVYRDVE